MSMDREENGLDWMARQARPLHDALRKYPDSFEALHFLFNEINALRAAPSQGDAQNGGLRRLLKEARQYVSDAGGDWDMETRANSQNLLEEIDRALTQPSAQSKDAAQ